jgi:hypothetical protein
MNPSRLDPDEILRIEDVSGKRRRATRSFGVLLNIKLIGIIRTMARAGPTSLAI